MFLGFATTEVSGTCSFDSKRPTTSTAKSTPPPCKAFKGPIRSGSSLTRAYVVLDRTDRSTAERILYRRNIGVRQIGRFNQAETLRMNRAYL